MECKSKKKEQAGLSQPAGANLLHVPVLYSLFLPDLFAAAQRLRIASARRLRPAAVIPRFFLGPAAGLLELPGGLPRRFA